MIPADVVIMPEAAAHDIEIEHINDEAFGPGRYARAAFKIREGGPHERQLSFVAMHDGAVIGSVRLTRIAAGEGRALLLGPLCVRPEHKNLGIGRKLMKTCIDAAQASGAGVILLVGDEPYYGPFGFKRVRHGQITMPRPVDPARLLAFELVPGMVNRLDGDVCHEDQVQGHAALAIRAVAVAACHG